MNRWIDSNRESEFSISHHTWTVGPTGAEYVQTITCRCQDNQYHVVVVLCGRDVTVNILAEQQMHKAIQGFAGGIGKGGKLISNFWCADDIVLLATSPEEQHCKSWWTVSGGCTGVQYVVTFIEKVPEVMVDRESVGASRLFCVFEEQSDEWCRLCRWGEAQDSHGFAVMVKLTKMWKNKSVSTITKLRLIKALV